jgi:hypothetical protein
MSEKEPIRLFVTHAFREHEEYARVFEYLESRDNFFYVNSSTPEDKPDAGDSEAIQESIRRQIKPVEVVLFPVAVANEDPALIDFELKVAQAFKKPILAIKSYGETQNLSSELLAAATEVVEWDGRAITEAAGRLARGGDKQPWDVIEFDMD